MAYRRDYLHRDGRPPPPYSKHKPGANATATASSGAAALTSDSRFTPELFRDMSKKIAQLTKVICNLTNKIDDQDLSIRSMKDDHEGKVEQLQLETKNKVAEYKTKADALQARLDEEQKLKSQREEEFHLLKRFCKFSENCKLLKHSLRLNHSLDKTPNHVDLNKLDESAHQLEKEMSSDPNTMGLRLSHLNNHKSYGDVNFIGNKLKGMEKYQEEVRTLLEDCERLKAEKVEMQAKYETELNDMRTKQEKNDKERTYASAVSNMCPRNTSLKEELERQEMHYRKRIGELLQHLSQSENRAEKYKKEIKQLEQSTTSKEKQLSAIKDELARVVEHLKQSQVVANETLTSNARQKQELQERNDLLAKLEAERKDFQMTLSVSKSQIEQLTNNLQELQKQAEAQQEKLFQKESRLKESLDFKKKFEEEVMRAESVRRENEDRDRRREELHERHTREMEDSFSSKMAALLSTAEERERILTTQLEEMKVQYENQLEEERHVHSAIQENLEQQLDLLQLNMQHTIRSESDELSYVHLLLEEKEFCLEKLKEEVDCSRTAITNLENRLKEKKVELGEVKDNLQFSQTELKFSSSEWEKKNTEMSKSHQEQLKQMINDLNQEWEEKMKMLTIQLQCSDDKIKEEIASRQKKDIAPINVNLQAEVKELSDEMTSFKDKLRTAERELLEEKESHQGILTEYANIKAQLENLERKHRDELLELQSAIEAAQATIKDKEVLLKEKQEEVEKAAFDSHRSNLEAMKLDLQHRYAEEQRIRGKQLEEQIESLKEEVLSAKRKDEEQQRTHRAEEEDLQTKLKELQKEINEKDDISCSREKQFFHDLSVEQNQVNQLRGLIESLQGEQEKLIEEREHKMNDLMRLRNEATQQIRNLESYWQERLVRELRKASHSFEHEKQKLTSNFNKGQRLLKDKIVLLQSIIHDLQDRKCKQQSLEKDIETIKELQKMIDEKDSAIYKLKEEKKTLHLELINQKCDSIKAFSSQPFVNNLESVLSLKKPRLERPPLTPQLVRRHSLLGPAEQKWLRARSQSPLRGIQPDPVVMTSTTSSQPKIPVHRASWSGESVADLQNCSGNRTETSFSKAVSAEFLVTKNAIQKSTESLEEKSELSETDPSIENSSSEGLKQGKNPTVEDGEAIFSHETLANHICDTIAECDELLMSLEDDEKQINNVSIKSNDEKLTILNFKDWENMPIPESEI